MVLLLREPVARAVSSWRYYCRACSDGFPCDRTSRSSCPNIGLLEFWDTMPQNPYVNRFVPARGSVLDAAALDELTATAVGAVKRSVANNATLVLFTENLDCATSSLSAFIGGAKVGATQHAKTHTQQGSGENSPTRADIDALGHILRYDIAFYRALFAAYGRDCGA